MCRDFASLRFPLAAPENHVAACSRSVVTLSNDVAALRYDVAASWQNAGMPRSLGDLLANYLAAFWWNLAPKFCLFAAKRPLLAAMQGYIAAKWRVNAANLRRVAAFFSDGLWCRAEMLHLTAAPRRREDLQGLGYVVTRKPSQTLSTAEWKSSIPSSRPD
jgi:hypothetical protein